MELKHKTIFESSVCAGACKYHLFIIIILITILSFVSYCTIRFFARGYICLFEKKKFSLLRKGRHIYSTLKKNFCIH